MEAIPDVESASADHEAGTVTVDGEADREELSAAIADAGYELA